MANSKVVVTRNDTKIVSTGVQGPQGEKGDQGDVTALEDIPGVNIESLNNNDILRYNSSASEWQNTPQDDLVDGGNF